MKAIVKSSAARKIAADSIKIGFEVGRRISIGGKGKPAVVLAYAVGAAIVGVGAAAAHAITQMRRK